MKRRNFIVLSALTAATVSIPFLNCNSHDPELDKKLAIPQTLSQILDQNTIKAIGKTYGTSHPDEYSLRPLEQQLKKNSEGKSVSSNASAKDIYSFLDKNIQNDFESGNTIVLNGWVLSLTEARQCAI
ncbi:MAG: hypothetical protein ABJA79_11200, partial [Parafilimonas sp.]